MINKISDTVAQWLLEKEVIQLDEVELYSYALYSLLLVSAPIIMVSLIGIIMNMLLKSILFITPFVLIRKFSGGFHLKSSTVCVFVSMVILTAFLIYIKFSLEYQVHAVTIIVTFISAIILMTQSPIDSEERMLSDKETKTFGNIARIITICFLIVITILAICHLFDLAIPISCGVILSGALQIPCCFLRQHHN